MTTTLLALLTALLLVDYPLAGVRMDLSEAPRSWQRLAGHGLAHAAVAYLLLGRPSQWILPVLAGASHLVIDGIEQQFDPRSGRVFAVASIVHVAVVRPSRSAAGSLSLDGMVGNRISERASLHPGSPADRLAWR